MKNLLLVALIVKSFVISESCTHSVASDNKLPEKSIAICAAAPIKIDQAELQSLPNRKILQILDLPSTIVYLGLEEPKSAPQYEKIKTVPKEMVYVPAGNVQIGSNDGFGQELPIFWASVKPFLMDEHPVTVAQFREFIKVTGYVTEAEKFGNAGIIDETTGKQWQLVDGANWEYPLGRSRGKATDNHPVTQVSWADANAYAKWAGKRLPSEIEWEHAARNGRNSREKYAWGEEIEDNGKWKGNVWQGTFPVQNFVNDQFAYTSPVGQFGKTELGLTDMSGNVWEWTSNRKFDYALLFKKSASVNEISKERAQRGGSFLCEPTWCHGYRVSGRSGSSEETSLFHLGFRCVKDI